jgi:LuxR family transcriptional activator of conjugal transfer of Ti plasmids
MTPHHEQLVTQAIAMLQAATKPEDIAGGAAALTAGLGLERYVVLGTSGTMVSALFHNAPSALQDEIGSLQSLGNDPVAAKTRVKRIPFVWDSTTGGDWRARNGDFGYRSGVAAASLDANGASCMVLLSCAEPSISDEHVHTLMAYALMAAVSLCEPMRQLAARPQAPCPLTERELECLLYASAGRSAKETARALGIGFRTVSQYLERTRAKLQVKTTQAAATIAIRNGWLNVQEALDLAA